MSETKCECRYFVAAGTCLHIAGTRPPLSPLPPNAHRETRDIEYEEAFLANVVTMATHLGCPNDAAFTRFVHHRADGTGAERYGDTSFLHDDRDLVEEAREEAGDIGVYTVFAAEKAVEPTDTETYQALVLAAAHAAMSDYYLRVVHRLKRDG